MKNKNMFLAAITVVFGISGYVFWPPLILISYIPLIYMLYHGGGFLWHHYLGVAACGLAIALGPLILYEIPAYLASVAFASLYLWLFAVVSRFLIVKYNNKRSTVLIPAFVWMLLYYLLNMRGLLSGAFNLGAFVPYSAPIIWHTGSVGITFLILLMNTFIAYALARKDKLAFAAGLAVILILGSSFIYSNTKEPGDFTASVKPVKIALIQGNIHEKWEWLEKNPYISLETYGNLSLKAAKEKPDLIVWPEFALPLDFINYNADLRGAVKEMVTRCGTDFIIGSILYDKKTGLHDDAGLFFDKRGGLTGYYASVDPAPFNLFVKRSGKEPEPLRDGAGIMVCWEEMNDSISRKYVNLGSGYLVSISNNQNLDRTWLKRVAGYASRARAAENKRYLARAANTGITQIVSPLGRVIKNIKPQKSGILIGEIYPISGKTFYSRHGDILVKLSLFLIFLYLLILYRFKTKPVDR